MSLAKIVRRGKFYQFASAPHVKVFGAVVVKDMYESAGKRYLKVNLQECTRQSYVRHELTNIDRAIDKAVNPRFSPVRYAEEHDWGEVVLKVLDSCSWEDAAGPAKPFWPVEHDVVDVVVAPGAFGDFGWCLNVVKIKRSATTLKPPPSIPPGSP